MAQWLTLHPILLRSTLWTVAAAAVAIGTFMWATGQLDIENVGYTGTFIINLVGSAAVIVPVPGLAATCVAAAPHLGLNLGVLGMLGAAGSTIGEIIGYLVGYGSQGLVQKSRHYARIHGWVVKRGGLTLFLLAAVPNPFFDIGGIAAGSLGYPVRKFLFYVMLGKSVKFVLIAIGCRYSIEFVRSIVL
ncbi:MAG: VTT domain-containing protein [Dehalococcoidia bacterium]